MNLKTELNRLEMINEDLKRSLAISHIALTVTTFVLLFSSIVLIMWLLKG